MAFLGTLSATALASLSSILGNLTLFGVIILFPVIGALRRVKVYEAFVEGAKEGFDVAKGLLPYLVAMLCAVGVLRASGALELALDGIRHTVEWIGLDTRFVEGLPTALVKLFFWQRGTRHADRDHADPRRRQLPCPSGGDGAGQHRDDLLCAGGVLRRGGHPAGAARRGCALLAELSGVIAAILVCYWFFA